MRDPHTPTNRCVRLWWRHDCARERLADRASFCPLLLSFTGLGNGGANPYVLFHATYPRSLSSAPSYGIDHETEVAAATAAIKRRDRFRLNAVPAAAAAAPPPSTSTNIKGTGESFGSRERGKEGRREGEEGPFTKITIFPPLASEIRETKSANDLS